jgi:hypothetical protein
MGTAMREYPKHIKRMIREYAAQAYEIELGQALGELEQQFALWRAGQISAGELSDRIHAFHQGPSRELWGRYNARIDDMLVAHAIVTGLLPRETIPAELLEALQPRMDFYEREQAAREQEAE